MIIRYAFNRQFSSCKSWWQCFGNSRSLRRVLMQNVARKFFPGQLREQPSSLKIQSFSTTQHKSWLSSDVLMPLIEYDHIVSDTLEEMADYFDRLADDGLLPEDYDSNLADGVLTVYLAEHGTYVINKQTPNRQIWLSSPTSGPKRYDFTGNTWFYSHDPDTTLHELLSQEISEITNSPTDFTKLAYGKR